MQIPLGTLKESHQRWYGKEANITIRPFGVTLLLSLPRIGKSVVGRNILLELYKRINSFDNKRIIIVDVYGEWIEKLLTMNYYADHPFKMHEKDITHLENVVCKISDFNKLEDWVSFEVPERTSDLLAWAAQQVQVHDDDPDKFLGFLREIPTRDVPDLSQFNKKYADKGIHLSKRVDDKVATAMCNYVSSLVRRGFFKKEGDDKLYLTTEDWEGILEKTDVYKRGKIIIINLKLKGPTEKVKARATFGKILEQLEPIMMRGYYHFHFFVEEADFTFPYLEEKFDTLPLSVIKGIEYVTKFQKFHVNFYLIAQRERRLTRSIATLATCRIISRVAPDEFKWNLDIGLKCKWHPDRNMREFCIVDQNGKYRYFYAL